MIRKCIALSMITMGLVFILPGARAQEFPIATGNDTTFSGGAVYGGLNGLVAVHGDATTQHNITAQLVGSGGSLIGSRISIGATGIMPGATPIFDGTNYFLIWLDFSGTLKGQFINTSGGLVGSSFTVATNVSTTWMSPFRVAASDSSLFAAFIKADGYLYGQRISRSGGLVGSQVQISSNLAREISLAHDGVNFLTAWVEVIPQTDKDIYGQFVSKSGVLIGSNFLIDGGPNFSDNPTCLAFDGTRYLLAFHEQSVLGGHWMLMGCFITTAGGINETVTLCDSSLGPNIPSLAFDTNNYLFTWFQETNGSMMGRFFDKSGAPAGSSFVIFAPLGNKIPFGGVGYGGGLYLAVATRVTATFDDGDVYGRFIQPLTGVASTEDPIPARFELRQNFPNPFNPSTTISFDISVASRTTLRVYDLLGREVATLVDGMKEPGRYDIRFDGSALASGTYLYRLKAGEFTETKTLVLVR